MSASGPSGPLVNQMSFKYHMWIASNSGSSSNRGFIRQMITKIADKKATTYQLELVDALH